MEAPTPPRATRSYDRAVDPPATWDQLFQLFHHVWGETADGRYDKDTWHALSTGLYELAEQAGYRRRIPQ